jgi:arginyl-tRNA synthetase
MYSTTDLGTIIDRMETHNPAKILYVVDQRQSLHFEQVFRAARKGELVSADTPELTFAGFGTMNGTDGKPFKTRAGGVMKLEDLIAMGVEKAQARLDEANLSDDIDEAERADIANKVALAAIKFADLQNQRQSDYVFDLDRMTSFEGKTGPYLLYQAVRIQSLLKKAKKEGLVPIDVHVEDLTDAERGLALLLTELPDHFENALKGYTPHVLCDYAYRLAQEFSSFYGNCHILSEDNQSLRNSRLALCAQTHRQLVLVLSLLGIEVPERM